ncbi:SDR family oxidoreductase [Streptomyces triticiradicis]|uniref:SDR family oxidoreductase n=1 Tax=Streptomyces triticiradicis TaxID=2651189 RepID=A0A7J5DPQ9_9ACTN|nr:SDR family oxidoreductase [Streptomyces triticiradicis]KAB1990774.1 SDR family oxidoreductase [Streptomyces triticiradicis]
MRVFVTGASGWIGSALVPELIGAGHQVVGLARSDASAAALTEAGAEAVSGTLDDLDVLRETAKASDGVIHLAFKHDLAFTGGFQDAADADRRAVETFGDVLAGSGKPFVIASGLVGVAPGRVSTEADGRTPDGATAHLPGGPRTRMGTAHVTLALADRNVRSSVVRLPPTVHGEGDGGFVPALIGIARDKGVAGYVGDGTQRWPATHRDDAARVFRLALEGAPAGSVLHASAEDGVPLRSVAEAIGRHLDVPTRSVPAEEAAEHFTWLSGFIGLDSPASSERTRELLGWHPTGPGLIEDLDKGHYFRTDGE